MAATDGPATGLVLPTGRHGLFGGGRNARTDSGLVAAIGDRQSDRRVLPAQIHHLGARRQRVLRRCRAGRQPGIRFRAGPLHVLPPVAGHVLRVRRASETATGRCALLQIGTPAGHDGPGHPGCPGGPSRRLSVRRLGEPVLALRGHIGHGALLPRAVRVGDSRGTRLRGPVGWDAHAVGRRARRCLAG